MAWFKVDDRLTVSSKVMRIPRSKRIEAMGLWVMCGAWSAHDLTDGFIPAYVVDELGGTKTAIQALLDARLWEPDSHDGDDGYQFVNWADYQPTKETIEERRARDAERKRSQRRTESGQFASDSDAVQPESEQRPRGHDADSENVQPESAVPVPSRPVPSLLLVGDADEESREEVREDVESLCLHLATRITENGNKPPTITLAWRTQARLLLDRDKRELDEAHRLIDWCQADSFWMSNILSMPKFREQYDKLRLRSGIRNPGQPAPNDRIAHAHRNRIPENFV